MTLNLDEFVHWLLPFPSLSGGLGCCFVNITYLPNGSQFLSPLESTLTSPLPCPPYRGAGEALGATPVGATTVVSPPVWWRMVALLPRLSQDSDTPPT